MAISLRSMAISLKWLDDNDLRRRGQYPVKAGHQPFHVVALDMPLMVFAAGPVAATPIVLEYSARKRY
jgi:hypothetical protein